MPANMDITVMYLNPIGNSDYDETFAEMIKGYKYPQTTAYVVSMSGNDVPAKMSNLEYRTYESYIVNETVKVARYCSVHNFDAMVIGCFYDPALLDAREISDNTVVVAPCQASIAAALNVGNNFSVIIGERKWEDQMKQTVYEYGFRDRLASFESVGLRVEDFHNDPAKTKEKLELAAIEAVTIHRAESIILGCTLEVGFYQELQDFLSAQIGGNVPVIDCSIAAFKAAENAALQKQWGWRNSRIWGMQPPPEAELAKFGLLQEDVKFGNMTKINPDGTMTRHLAGMAN